MATNKVRERGNRLNAIPTDGLVASGNPILYKNIPAVATGVADSGDAVVGDLEGVYNLSVTDAADLGDVIGATAGGAGVALVLTAYADRAALDTAGDVPFGYAFASQAATGILPVKLGI